MAKSNFIVRGGADFSGINKSLAATQKKIGAFQSSVSKSMKLVTTVIGVLAVKSIIKDTTKMAMSVESSTDNINRNLKESAGAFFNWTESQSKAWGIAKKDAYTYGSTFSNLISSFQADSKATADSTLDLMKASAIIASKTGRTYDDVTNRIRSGMLGSTEAIEDLGVYTNISMIESTNAFKKFANGKSWTQLEFKVQQQIRLASILEQTYARYGDTLAETTQTRQARFLASLNNIKLNLGQTFLPIYNVVLPALTALGNMFENLTSKLAVLSESFFGKAISIQAEAIESNADAMTEYGDAAETAGKQAKGATAPFDELIQIGGGTNASNIPGTAPSNGSDTPKKDSIVVTDKDTGFTKWLAKLGEVAEPTINALGRLKDATKPLVDFVFDNWKNFYNGALKPIGTWILGEGFPKLADIVTNMLSKINWTKLTEGFKNLYEALGPFAVAVGEGLISFIGGVASFLTPGLSTTTSLFADGLNGLAKGIKAIPEDVARAIGGAIGALVTAIVAYKAINLSIDAIKGVGTAMKTSIGLIAKHPVVAIAAAVSALAAAVAVYLNSKVSNSEAGKLADHLKDMSKNIDKYNNSVDELLKKQKDNRDGIENEYGAIQLLADKYIKLNGATNKTNEETKLQIAYGQELIKAIPELNGLIDEQTGAYKGTREELEGLITKSKEYYLVEAAKESLKEIYSKMFEAQKQIVEVTEARAAAQAELTRTEEEANLTMLDRLNGTERFNLANVENIAKIGELRKAIQEADAKIAECTVTQSNLNDQIDYATGFITNYSTGAKKDFAEVETAIKSTESAFKKADIGGNAKQMTKTFGSVFDTDTSAVSSVKRWLQGISNAITNWKAPQVNLPTLNEQFAGKTAPWGNPLAIKQYASGGLPPVGDLFVANEKGPEWVSTMGGRTAVANRDQISEGVEEASYRGMTRALREHGGLTANVMLSADTKGIFKVVQTEGRDYEVRTGNPVFN